MGSRVFLRGGIAAVAAVVACVFAGPALADGSKTIAGAPELPTGTNVVSGANGGGSGEFWRLTLKAGDQVTFDYGTTNGCYVYLTVYLPSVTDNTFRDGDGVTYDATSSKGQLKWTATGAGAWIVRFSNTCSTLGYEVATAVVRSNANQSSGATTIGAAPQLPLGAQIVSGANGGGSGEFWRLTLKAGDQVTFDYGTTNGCYVYLTVYLPSVTDNTFRDASGVTYDATSSKGQLKWTATGAGAWIVRFSNTCSTLGYEVTPRVAAGSANQAAGGATIPTATTLPLRSTVVSGAAAGSYGEFWRIQMNAGDVLTLDYAGLNGVGIYVSVYKPDVTENTFRDASPTFSDSSSSSAHVTWRATGSGAWLLRVDCNCNALAYAIGAKVQVPTALTLRAPASGKSNQAFRVSGSVSRGASSGTVTLVFSAAGKRAVKFTGALGGSGAFAVNVKLARGTYSVRATYSGDDGHLGSAGRSTVRVT